MIGKSIAVCALAVLTLPAMGGFASAQRVNNVGVESCTFTRGMNSCVQRYRSDEAGPTDIQQVANPADIAESRERERKWVERCKPVVRQDAYGVGRYVYAARGCEFGRIED